MFTKGISPKTRRSLALLGQLKELGQFYLAGGTAVALRFGHRLSFDLDFFTPNDFSQKELIKLMDRKGKFDLGQVSKNTLLGLFEQTKVSFFKYDYPLIDETTNFDDVTIVGQKDLMAMKVDAISSRGTKRDFIDLYFLLGKQDLGKAINCYEEKYKKANINIFHVLKSLNYFIDAEELKMPEMLVPCAWEEVKKFFLIQVPKVLSKRI